MLLATLLGGGPAGVADARPTAAPVVAFAKGTSARPAKGGGVLVRWRTTRERGIVGFDLYRARRTTPRTRVRITPRLVAGSVGRIGATRTLTRSTGYVRLDRSGRRGDRYWIRPYGTAGALAWRGPTTARGRAVRVPRALSALLKTARRPTAATSTVPTVSPAPTIAPGTPPDQVQAQLAARQTVRLGVDADGWQRVELADLAARGLDTSRPENLHVFTGGTEVAALVRGGGLEFYGQAIDAADTDTRAYVVDAQTGPGRRLASADPTPTGPAPASVPATVTRTDRDVYVFNLVDGPRPNFFGLPLSASGTSIALAAPDAAGGTGTLRVSLLGLSPGDHAVTVALNGTPLGTITGRDREQPTQTFTAPAVLDGTNTVTLTTSGDDDIVLRSSVSLTYPRRLAADDGEVVLGVPGGRRTAVSGLAAGARVVDVTDPLSPVALATTQAGSTATATAPAGGTRRLYAFSPAAIRAPRSIDVGLPSTLGDPATQGQLTVITTPGYFSALAPLVARRRAQGMSVKVVALQDIYDEFSFGTADHTAIRRFLDAARASWRTPPSYVLLGGDGTFDPRGFQGRGTDRDVVPIALVDTTTEETASDTALTGVAATGRLPARTAAQMQALVAKVLALEDRSPAQAATLVSDVNDTWDFAAGTEALRPLLPPSFAVTRVDRAAGGDVKGTLVASLDAGPTVVNYAGHGNVDLWRGDLLTNADAGALRNVGRPSIYVMMTCLNGYFMDPELDSLGEALMLAPGGAGAVFSSTGTTNPQPQEAVDQALVGDLFDGSSPRIGDAVARALAATTDPDVRSTFMLLGDPTSTVR